MAFLFKFKSILYNNNSACPAETLVKHIKKKIETSTGRLRLHFTKRFVTNKKGLFEKKKKKYC